MFGSNFVEMVTFSLFVSIDFSFFPAEYESGIATLAATISRGSKRYSAVNLSSRIFSALELLLQSQQRLQLQRHGSPSTSQLSEFTGFDFTLTVCLLDSFSLPLFLPIQICCATRSSRTLCRSSRRTSISKAIFVTSPLQQQRLPLRHSKSTDTNLLSRRSSTNASPGRCANSSQKILKFR
jgi:hypothetical protein